MNSCRPLSAATDLEKGTFPFGAGILWPMHEGNGSAAPGLCATALCLLPDLEGVCVLSQQSSWICSMFPAEPVPVQREQQVERDTTDVVFFLFSFPDVSGGNKQWKRSTLELTNATQSDQSSTPIQWRS